MGLFFGMCWYVWHTKVKNVALTSMVEQELFLEELHAQDAYLEKEIVHQKNKVLVSETEANILQKKFDLWLRLVQDQKQSKENSQVVIQKNIEARARIQRALFEKKQYTMIVAPKIIRSVKTRFEKLVENPKTGSSVIQTIVNQLDNKPA